MFRRRDINSMRHDLCSVCCERFSRVVFFDRSRCKSDESTTSIIIGTDKKIQRVARWDRSPGKNDVTHIGIHFSEIRRHP